LCPRSYTDKDGGKSLYFMYMPGREMLLEEFKKNFANYMRFRHPSVKYKWRQDCSAFKRLGYDGAANNIQAIISRHYKLSFIGSDRGIARFIISSLWPV
jgi:hypothetical protein